MIKRRSAKGARPAGEAGGGLSGKLAQLGLTSDTALLLHLPLRYEDETRITRVAQATPGEDAQFEVIVRHATVQFRPRRQLVAQTVDANVDADADAEAHMLVLRFLSFYPSMQKLLVTGQRLRVFGMVREGFWGAEIIHPRLHAISAGAALPTALTPVYPTTAGLSQAHLRRLIQRARLRTVLDDTVPEVIRRRFALVPFMDSLRQLHEPPAGVPPGDLPARTQAARRRIAFDELLAQQLSLRQAHAQRRERGATALKDTRLADALCATLPFRLTTAQSRVWQEIAADLAQPHPMQRLLQGDVGSGKTIVAALAMLTAAAAQKQAALMAPTELLAEQHYRKLAAWLTPLGQPVAWLSGQMKAGERRQMMARIMSGDAKIIVGTHALIEDAVNFDELALAVIDEQHRFGVRQRLALKQKSLQAHQLTMSATPIPRTLAMSYYADLDVSTLDELPPGRSPVRTRLINAARRDDVVSRVGTACRQGRQAYWVCPLIEESEALQLQTAVETYERLTAELPDLNIGLVHGRLKAAEKTEVMARFQRHELQLLVATTVIEVGVDVANASLMVIEHAERFGLAQLHQLRGRVGRGCDASVCILLFDAQAGFMARQRLKIIFECNDGFDIAQRDLMLRGPGEFIGSRQSGVPLLRFADLEDTDLLAQVRLAAEEMRTHWPEAAQEHIARWLAGREELLKA